MERNILNQIASGGNFVIQISAQDLKEVVSEMYQDERNRTENAIAKHREKPTLTRKEAADILGVTLSTLWQWAKSGYLVPVKIGSKVMYRPSDIEELMLLNVSK